VPSPLLCLLASDSFYITKLLPNNSGLRASGKVFIIPSKPSVLVIGYGGFNNSFLLPIRATRSRGRSRKVWASHAEAPKPPKRSDTG
jgi:hypothetical protein